MSGKRSRKAAAPPPQADDEEYVADGMVARMAIRVMENPALSGGLFVMALTATAIISNAMFMQSGRHPDPLFMTRPGPEAAVPLPRSRVERPPEAPIVAAAPAPVPAQRPPPEPRPAPVQAAVPPTSEAAVVRAIQEILSARGLYAGTVDGVSGSRTRAAVSTYQKAVGLPATGEPTIEVLNHMRGSAAATAAASPAPPPPTPSAVTMASAPQPAVPATRAATPVETTAPMATQPAAAAPAAAVQQPVAAATPTAAPTAVPGIATPAPATVAKPAGPGAVTTTTAAASASPDALVRSRYAAIQRALNRIGYGPIDEDGFGGGDTADAIRRFELDNGLPITGAAGDRVIERLVAIGAMPAT